MGQITATDFFVVPTATYRLLFVLGILAHERRRVVHVAVTDHPTAAWTAQQLRNAFPSDACPSYLLHDRDAAFAATAATIAGVPRRCDTRRRRIAMPFFGLASWRWRIGIVATTATW